MSMMNTLRKTLSGQEGEDQDADILDSLKQDHDDVAEMLEKLVESESGAERKSLLVSIKMALVPHLRAEEKVVYEAVLALRGKEQKTHAEEGYIEHGLGDKMLASLGKMKDAMAPEFSAGAKVLKELVEHHIQEEERNVWGDARKHFSEEDRAQMNTAYLAAKSRVKVR